MRISSILGVIEPQSYSLENSHSWALRQATKKKHSPVLSSKTTQQKALLQHFRPILQPIRVQVSAANYFLLFHRAIFEAEESFDVKREDSFSLSSVESQSLGTVIGGRTVGFNLHGSSVATQPRKKRPGILPLLSVASNAAGISTENAKGLLNYVTFLTSTMWPAEPIARTTNGHHLASNGKFMSADEITGSSLSGGILLISSDTFSVQSGPSPIVLARGVASPSFYEDSGSSGSGGGGGSGSGSGSSSSSSSSGSSGTCS